MRNYTCYITLNIMIPYWTSQVQEHKHVTNHPIRRYCNTSCAYHGLVITPLPHQQKNYVFGTIDDLKGDRTNYTSLSAHEQKDVT
jgi:hypothetical protein